MLQTETRLKAGVLGRAREFTEQASVTSHIGPEITSRPAQENRTLAFRTRFRKIFVMARGRPFAVSPARFCARCPRAVLARDSARFSLAISSLTGRRRCDRVRAFYVRFAGRGAQEAAHVGAS